MTYQMRTWVSWFTLVVLVLLAFWQIAAGNIGFGAGLLAGTLGASVIKWIKLKQLQKMQARGLNPYDERAHMIAGKAAYASLSVFTVVSALFVLAGSLLGPDIKVNPYNLLGICIALLVFIYVAFYYCYNTKL